MPTRWCPTPEQLMILEEMYKNGLRTPNASQIQKITAHLSNYGKIEGKNVFYWFQNHKARDRQKLRRKLLSKHDVQKYNNFEGYNSVQPCSFGEYLPDQGGGEGAQMTNCKWKLDTPYTYKLQSMMAESNGDDWMMMMLREVCGIDQCCSHNKKNRPLKTLELFPIKGIKSIKEEEQQRFTTNFNHENDSTSSITLEINSFFVNVTSCKHG